MVEAMNLMGYDALALGPRDLGLGINALRERMEEARFAVLSANLTVEGESLAAPYTIMERGGVRVAVLGVTGPLPAPLEGVAVSDPADAVREHLNDLSAQVDLMVVLSNLGPAPEQELARQVPGIDLIVGGGSGAPRSGVVWEGETALVRAGGLGEYLGITEVILGAQGNLSVSSESLALGPDVPDDPEMTALKSRYQQEYYAAPTVAPR